MIFFTTKPAWIFMKFTKTILQTFRIMDKKKLFEFESSTLRNWDGTEHSENQRK